MIVRPAIAKRESELNEELSSSGEGDGYRATGPLDRFHGAMPGDDARD